MQCFTKLHKLHFWTHKVQISTVYSRQNVYPQISTLSHGECSPHSLFYIFITDFSNILSHMPWPYKLPLPYRLADQIWEAFFISPMYATCPAHSALVNFHSMSPPDSKIRIPHVSGVPRGLGGCSTPPPPPPDFPKALQNRVKLNANVKTVKDCWI